MKRSFIREILECTTRDTISFAGGLPDEKLFPNQDLKESAKNVLDDASTLQYAATSGLESLRKKIADMYSKNGFETKADNILITSGSQQALDIIARHNKGKSITIESPSYLGAMNAFGMNGLTQDAVELKDDGINIDMFDASFKTTNLAYLIPDYQNPTGYTYSDTKRAEIANIVEKYSGILIEDSPYSELYFEKKYQSISSMVPSHSFHLGSFSKTLAPALRIGWIRADEQLLEPLIAYKEAMDLHTNSLSQSILNDYLEHTGRYDEHLELLRQVYAKKMQIFKGYLNELLPEFVCTKPKGGMFIYGELPGIDTSELVQKCLASGVVFVPGQEFFADGLKNSEIRFNFTHCKAVDIARGLKVIQGVLKESRGC